MRHKATIGYIRTKERGRWEYEHTVVWEKANGPIPEGYEIDHINRDRADNRLENLRLVTRSENNWNQTTRKDNFCGVKGVHPVRNNPGAWRSEMKYKGKTTRLYYGYDFFEAVCARKSWESSVGVGG